MTAYIARRLDRLEERLAISEGQPKINRIIVYCVAPSPNGPVEDVQNNQTVQLDNGEVLYRDADETLEHFMDRIPAPTDRRPDGGVSCLILEKAENFSDAESTKAKNQ